MLSMGVPAAVFSADGKPIATRLFDTYVMPRSSGDCEPTIPVMNENTSEAARPTTLAFALICFCMSRAALPARLAALPIFS